MTERYDLAGSTANGCLVWLEVERGSTGDVRISDASRMVLNKAGEMGCPPLLATVFGHMELKPLYHGIYGDGVSTLYEVHDKRLREFMPEAYADALKDIIIRTNVAVVLFPDSKRGRELAPRVASLLGAGYYPAADSMELDKDGRTVVFGRGGRGRARCATLPQIATVDVGSSPVPEEKDGSGTCVYWQVRDPLIKEIR